MQISVYGAASYDRSGKIRWLLEELGVDYRDRWLDVEKGERDSGAYLKVNPLGRIPAVTIDDRPMIESNAICAHIADQYLEKGLAPETTARERLDYQQWMYYAVSLDSLASRISIIEDIPPGEIHDQKLKAFTEEVKDLIGFLGDSLSQKQYLTGKFSAADVCVGYHLYFVSLWPEINEIIEANGQVAAYLQRLRDRPGARKANVFSFEQ